MFRKEGFFVVLVFVLLFAITVGFAHAAPPLQTGDGSSLGETLDLDNVDTADKTNLGTIMSGRRDADDVDQEEPEEPEEPADPENPDQEDPDQEDPEGDGPVQQHPVGMALADYFEVPYDEIMALHQAGNGFGTITKAYFFADKIDDMSPSQLLDAAHGSGWGNLLKENGIHPGNGNGPQNGPPGQEKKNGGDEESTDDLVSGQGNGNGHKGGNGRGNGNNGNGNGNNGNGRGNGKSGK